MTLNGPDDEPISCRTARPTRVGTAYAYTINDAGRVSQVKVGGQVRATYTYDWRNRLSVRQILNMSPAGTTHYVYDLRDRLIAETNGAGTTIREYIWVEDWPVAVLDGTSSTTNPTLLFVHSDHLKRPDYMTNAAKTVVWRALYEPFGTVHSITGTAANTQRFPGQWFQLEAGLHYNWWRHYDAATGRYTQPDPLGLSQGPGVPGAFPNGRFANAAPGASLSTEGLPQASLGAQPGLAAALAALARDGRQQPLGMGTGFASTNADTVMRDGTSLYGYAGQSPGMYTDPEGLMRRRAPPPPLPIAFGREPGRAILTGPTSLYEPTTLPNSRIANRRTNVCLPDFQRNLEAAGYSRTAAQSPGVTFFDKGGNRYTKYEISGSGPPSAQFNYQGQPILKIRLQPQWTSR